MKRNANGCRHVAVDATCWTNSRGYGRHARDLLTALARTDTENKYCFFVDSEEALKRVPEGVDSVLVKVQAPTAKAAAADGRRALMDVWQMSRALSSPEFDLILFPTVYSYVPVFSRAHQVVFIHDVIAETYPDMTVPSLPARWLWRSKIRLALRQAGTIVTVSEHSRRGITGIFKLDPKEIRVIGEAPNPIFRRLNHVEMPDLLKQKLPDGGRKIVYVGGFGPHKNLTRLVEVFARLAGQPDLADLSLILVGEYQNEVFYSAYQEIRQRIELLGIAGRVIFTGYLSDEDLVLLLNLAEVLALPSLLEGFGLPAVEAAACGCPVVATKASPLPELLGEGGIFIDPLDERSLEEALTRVLCSEQLRLEMRSAGLEAARALTWDRHALALKELIETVLIR